MPHLKHILCWLKLTFWARWSLQQMPSLTILILARSITSAKTCTDLAGTGVNHKKKCCLYIPQENARNLLLMISQSKGWLLQKRFKGGKPTEALWHGGKIWIKCIGAVAKRSWQSCWDSSMTWLKSSEKLCSLSTSAGFHHQLFH